MKAFKMNVIDWSALLLVFVGALNWGLVGVAHFVDAAANWNIVNVLLGGSPEIEALVYVLVGLASLWTAYLATRMIGVSVEEITPEPETVTQSKK
jgi:uncharacterized membrane protein YuzA (DUF378 family)